MKKILILGATGNIGYALYNYLLKKKLNILGTTRKKYLKKKFVYVKDLSNYFELYSIIKNFKPSYIVNCLSVKDMNNNYDLVKIFYQVNKNIFFIQKKIKFNYINISTDAVFSGQKIGYYTENSIPDPNSSYGWIKYISEFQTRKTLNIRTSIIGFNHFNNKGMLNWFIKCKNKCYGFKNYFFTGVTNLELSKFIYALIHKKIFPCGTMNFASKKISKLDLLIKLNKKLKINKKIYPKSNPYVNRSLSSKKTSRIVNYSVPLWNKMIDELYKNESF